MIGEFKALFAAVWIEAFRDVFVRTATDQSNRLFTHADKVSAIEFLHSEDGFLIMSAISGMSVRECEQFLISCWRHGVTRRGFSFSVSGPSTMKKTPYDEMSRLRR